MERDEKDRYQELRRQAITRLESLGLEVVSLEVAAAFLPVIPEWQRYITKRLKRKEGSPYVACCRNNFGNQGPRRPGLRREKTRLRAEARTNYLSLVGKKRRRFSHSRRVRRRRAGQVRARPVYSWQRPGL